MRVVHTIPALISRYQIVLLLLFMLPAVFFAGWFMWQGTIDFHTDIARDFLLMQEIGETHHFPLIGPRAGGIPGVFHGPLWIYLSMPAYLAGHGNPVVVGWYWFALFLISIAIVWYAGRLMFDNRTGLIASIIYAIATSGSIHSLFNPFGAVLLSPILFSTCWLYLQTKKGIFAAVAISALGFMIQFQMAFAVPIGFIMLPLMINTMWIEGKLKHIFFLFLLIIPLSTFFLFEARHGFLQTNAVLHYLSSPNEAHNNIRDIYLRRLDAFFYDVPGMIAGYSNILVVTILLLLGIGYATAGQIDKKKYYYFSLMYIGYWLVTLPYRGIIWGYYTWPFVPIFAIWLASLNRHMNRVVCWLVFAVIFVINCSNLVKSHLISFDGKDTGGWRFYEKMSVDVIKHAPKEFGYFIYTTDQYGYSTRYAIDQAKRSNPAYKIAAFEKKPVTYLFIDDPGTHQFTNSSSWKKYDVKINSKPYKTTRYNSTYWVEEYHLSSEEIQKGSNPNMIHDLIFR